jgi:hypothetical protein
MIILLHSIGDYMLLTVNIFKIYNIKNKIMK